MSDDRDKDGGAVDLKRRDFLRGGFFRRALEQHKEQEARAPEPIRPQIPDHRAYLGQNDAGLTEEEQLAIARARARAMLGVVRPPQEQRPFDVFSLLEVLENEPPHKQAPPDDEPKIAQIDPDLCLAHQRSFCTTCVERCPEPGALTLQDHLPHIQPDLCTGCAECQRLCPAPINAIRLI